MNKLKRFWSNLWSSFWFMPSLIVMGNIAFAVALIEVDFEGSDRWLTQWPRLFGAGADGARFAIKCNGSTRWPSIPSSPPMTVRG